MATLEDILLDYNDYIRQMMRCDLPEHRKYQSLIDDLSDISFVWRLPMDENRDLDAIDLRMNYLVDNNIYFPDLVSAMRKVPRSCLEVLAALSRRIEINFNGDIEVEDDYSRWFWIMIENLGLNKFDDRHYDHGIVVYKLQIWLQRKFDISGNGSIFPLKIDKGDQTKVEIWYQMQNYMMENYPD